MKLSNLTLCVLALTATANAEVLITVDGVIDAPDVIPSWPSNTHEIGLWGDGLTLPDYFFMGIGTGDPASLDITNAVMLYPGDHSYLEWYDDSDAQEIADILGVEMPFLLIDLADVPLPPEPQDPLQGQLVDGIAFHLDGAPEATLYFFDAWGVLLDSKTFVNPEPATVLLLGVGATLILRRARHK